MVRLHRVILFFLLLPLSLHAQLKLAEPPKVEPRPPFSCGMAAAREALFQQQPAMARKQAEVDDQLYRKIFQKKNALAGKGAPLYTLPVVFHIIHDNGPENLPDDQVLAALGHLNDAFAHLGYFTGAGPGEDSGIRFCLARRTPDGLATTGITHTQSPLTNMTMETQDIAVKDLIRWDPTRYINIWIVASINSVSQGAGVAGYAYLPFAHGGPQDGMVCEAGFLGADPASDAVLIHEMGHYLGLYHTFEGGCPNDDCLLDGDRVCDTPPDQAQHSVCPFNSCSTDTDAPAPNPFSSDVDDLTSNFMDYSDFGCYAGFTAGQRDRMQATIEIIRGSLLESDACQDPCTQLIDAAFAPNPASGVAGGTVQMVNATTGATGFEWYVNGVLFSTAAAPSYVFNSSGAYTFQLIATNADPNCGDKFSLNYVVICPVEAGLTATQTQIQPGESVSFADNSINATSWQWLVNGTVVGTGPTLDYQFDALGIYTVTLVAGNGFCTDQAAVAIRVEGPCGGLVRLGHYRSGDPIYNRIIMNAPMFSQTGDILGVGSELDFNGNHLGILGKWNSAALLQWVKKSPGRYFHKALEAPDGNWVLYSVGTPCVAAKIKPDGTVLWAKSFDFPGNHPGYLGFDHLVVFPNGDIAAVMMTDNVGADVFRMDANGNLLWKKFFNSYSAVNISPAYDGSNNLWVYLYPFRYVVIAADGQQIVEMKEPNFLVDPYVGGGSLIRGNQHPDGSFSLWCATEAILPASQYAYVLYHFDPAGNLLWKKSIGLPYLTQHFVRYYPGDGWLLTININLEHVLVRLNDDGSTRWTRRFTSGGPAYIFHGFSGLEESLDGRVAGMCTFPYDTAFYLTVFDPLQSDVCDLVDHSLTSGYELPVVLNNVFVPLVNSTVPVTDYNLVLEDATLPFSAVCNTSVSCEEICGNGLDDDGDGLTDCADPDCQCQGHNVCIPDAAVSVDSVRCQGANLLVYLRLCNSGGGVLPAGTPLQWYTSDPTTSNALLYGPAQALPFNLPADSCSGWALSLPMPPGGIVWGVMNDNGSLPTPFDLGLDFPATAQPECDFSNNLVSVQFSLSTPLLDLGPDQTFCNSSVVTLHAGAGFARYRWADGSSDSSFTAFGPGTYWVDAWDVCGNLYTDSLHISLQTALPLDLGPDRTICPGDSITLAVTGFDALKWSPEQLFPCPDCASVVLTPDTSVLLRVTGRTGNCFVSDSLRVSVAAPPALSASIMPASCAAASGSITLTPSGGVPPYALLWENGATDFALDQLLPGDYAVTLTDANGCSIVQSFPLTGGAAPEISTVTLAQVQCFGQNNGQIIVDASGGTPPYQLNWSNGASGSAIGNLPAGDYALTLTDANNCTVEEQFVVQQPAEIAVQSMVQEDTCSQNTGSIQLIAGGGVLPYQLMWSDGQFGEVRSGLPAGNWAFTLTDANGCMTGQNIAVPAVEIPVVFSLNAGVITCAQPLSVAVATPNFEYQWLTPGGDLLDGATQMLDAAGDYSVTATNVFGCSATQVLTVTADTMPPLANVAAHEVVLSCDQPSAVLDGSASSSGPGIELHWFHWLNGQWTGDTPSATLPVDAPGLYLLQVNNGVNGCSASDSVLVLQPEGITSLLLSGDPVSCHGFSDGQIQVSGLEGGTAPFEYSIDNQNFMPSGQFAGLPAGQFVVYVRDAAGCTIQQELEIQEPPAISVQALVQADTCFQHTGSIQLAPAGGVPPYQVVWSDGQTGASLPGLLPGDWSFTLTDANGCATGQSIAVQEVQVPVVFSLTAEVITCAHPVGAAVATPYFEYQWLTPGGDLLNGPEQMVDVAGDYSVTATNAFGCSATQVLTVTADTTPPLALVAAQEVVIPCDQQTALLDGSASASGPSIELHWSQWLNGQWAGDTVSATLPANAPGLYLLQVDNLANGCTASDTVQVLQSEGISGLQLNGDSISCFGFSDGKIQVSSVEGGVPPYEYALDNQAFGSEAQFTGLPAGNYSVRVRDAAGCEAQASIQVAQPDSLILTLSASEMQVLAGASLTLQAEIQPPGAALASVQWQPVVLFPTQQQLIQTLSIQENTLFQVNIQSPEGCSASAAIEVRVRSAEVYLPNAFLPGRPGNDGFTVFGGPELEQVLVLRVFDRWGELVFERQHFAPNDTALGWNGRFRGRELPPGVFACYVEVKFVNGETRALKGNVQLIR